MSKLEYGYHMLFTLLIVIAQGVLTTGSVFAEEIPKTVSGTSTVTGGKKAVALYRPPRRGTPVTRIGGGSRGPDAGTPSLFVLTPKHTGLTRQEQPTLYWYTSRPVNATVEFALINDNDLQTVVETELSRAIREGIHKVSLKDLGVTLDKGVPYQWSVAIVIDKENRSGDVFASGTIERVSGAEPLPSVQQESSGEKTVFHYAQNGFWYDTLEAVARLIEEHPGENRFVELRASLLEQVELDEVAAYERALAH